MGIYVKFMICGNSEITRFENFWRETWNAALTPIPSFIFYISPFKKLLFKPFVIYGIYTECHAGHHLCIMTHCGIKIVLTQRIYITMSGGICKNLQSSVNLAQSGCCPSWAFHAHSVSSISVNTALKLESSGLHAYMPKEICPYNKGKEFVLCLHL